jgi:hypothetical protein
MSIAVKAGKAVRHPPSLIIRITAVASLAGAGSPGSGSFFSCPPEHLPEVAELLHARKRKHYSPETIAARVEQLAQITAKKKALM